MLDTEGKRIQAHGAGMIYENETYNWYGENKEFTTGKDEVWTWESVFILLKIWSTGRMKVL